MQFFNKISLSLASLVFISSINTFAYTTTAFISANSSGTLNIAETKIISSNEKGEIISKLSDNSSLFHLSISEDNQYTTEQYAKIINSDNSDVLVYLVPSNDSDILGKIPVGSTVLITRINENFVRILFNDTIGYIKTKYISTTDLMQEKNKKDENSSNIQPEKIFANITAQSGTAFREAPSENSKILKTLPFNTSVQILEIENNWLKVSYNKEIGFINKNFASTSNSNTNNTNNAKPENSTLTGQTIVDFAKNYLGKPYIYGSTNLEKGTDCSGFTYAIFKHFGINLNRVSKDQFLNGTPVNKENLMPGDLVFFNTGARINHVGIYIGNGQYIHSTDSKNQGVIISNLNSPYSSKYYYGARRVIN